MTHKPDFGDLRSLLNQPHTPQVWDQLCLWIDAFSQEEERQRILPYIQGHLERWSDQDRRVPRQWITRLMNQPKDEVPWLFITRHLNLRSVETRPRRSWRPREVELQAIWRRPALEALHIVDVGDLDLDEAQLMTLVQCPHLGRLRELNLQRNALSAPVLKQLSRSSLTGHLRELTLRKTKLEEDGLRALWSASWPVLERLDLSDNALQDDAWPADNAQASAALKALDVSKTQLTARALLTLSASWPQLRELRVDQLQSPGLTEALSQLPTLHQLRQLSAWGCALRGDALSRALLQSAAPLPLVELNLGKNALDDEALLPLLQRPEQLPALRRLTLYHNPITSRTYEALAASPLLAQLEELGLGQDQADAQGRAALKASPYLSEALRAQLTSR